MLSRAAYQKRTVSKYPSILGVDFFGLKMADLYLSHMILSKSKFVRILGDRKFAAIFVGDYFGRFLPG